MDTRKETMKHRKAHWTEVIQERQASGESIRSYCKKIGIHENVYYYWQRKLRVEALTEMQSATTNKTGTSIAPAGWVKCEEYTEKSKKKTLLIEIGKFKIKVNAETDHELLVSISQTLLPLC